MFTDYAESDPRYILEPAASKALAVFCFAVYIAALMLADWLERT